MKFKKSQDNHIIMSLNLNHKTTQYKEEFIMNQIIHNQTTMNLKNKCKIENKKRASIKKII